MSEDKDGTVPNLCYVESAELTVWLIGILISKKFLVSNGIKNTVGLKWLRG